MKPIERNEVLGLAEYETIRDRFRARVILEKKRRRVQLGPKATALFENRDTVLLQIQEMLRTERITRPAAIDHEIATYNETLPGDAELSCTVMIEIVDTPERDAFLQAAAGFENHVWLVVGEERIRASTKERDGAQSHRTTAVHYLKFQLSPACVEALRSGGSGVALETDHPVYAARVTLTQETLSELRGDFE